jgi:hypothetical protein
MLWDQGVRTVEHLRENLVHAGHGQAPEVRREWNQREQVYAEGSRLLAELTGADGLGRDRAYTQSQKPETR